MKVIIVNRMKWMWALGALLIVCSSIIYISRDRAATASVNDGESRTIQLVTGEFKTTTAEGKELEAYRWDPGTIYVKKGETIRLSIYGVNGASHPFVIEGLGISGEVKKGKETIVHFKADKEGTYRLICKIHPDIAHSGPMIGYIVVD